MIACPHCQLPVFRKSESGGKQKLQRSAVIVHSSGDIEINCPRCKRGLIVGQSSGTLRKATPRLIVRDRRAVPR